MNQLVEAIRSGALREPHCEDHFFLEVEEIRRYLVKGAIYPNHFTGFGLLLPGTRSNRRFFGCHCSHWEYSTVRCSPISPGMCPQATQERARAPRLPLLRPARNGGGS